MDKNIIFVLFVLFFCASFTQGMWKKNKILCKETFDHAEHLTGNGSCFVKKTTVFPKGSDGKSVPIQKCKAGMYLTMLPDNSTFGYDLKVIAKYKALLESEVLDGIRIDVTPSTGKDISYYVATPANYNRTQRMTKFKIKLRLNGEKETLKLGESYLVTVKSLPNNIDQTDAIEGCQINVKVPQKIMIKNKFWKINKRRNRKMRRQNRRMGKQNKRRRNWNNNYKFDYIS